MTAKRLADLLKLYDPDTLVVIAEDAEGNGFNLLTDIGDNYTWENGNIKIQELTPELRDLGFVNNDIGNGSPCIVFWP